MKLPIPLLLYTVSLGLVGLAGWTVYKLVPILRKESREAATRRGMDTAQSRLSMGRGQGPVSADWRYGQSGWWAEFKSVNFLGKLPPPPPKPKNAEEDEPKPDLTRDLRPLEQIIEIVSLVYDGKDAGKGELSHAIVRYRPEANVQPPEWYMRETMASPAGAAGAAGPRDTAPPARAGGNPGGPTGRAGGQRQQGPRGATSAMPTSLVGREILQKVWIQGDGDPRRAPTLWPPFTDIRLVRVDPSAQIAYFERTPPPPKSGEATVAAKEEALAKSSVGLSAELVQELQRLQGRPVAAARTQAAASLPIADGNWIEVEDTTLINNVRHIGRRQEERLRGNPDELMQSVHMDTYQSKYGNVKGLQVRNIEPRLAAEFGVSQGDVLIEVNGRPVKTQAEAVRFGEGEYQKGVRTFVTRWLSGGQIVERTYQAPNR